MIKSISYDQHEIIQNILDLHCPQGIELDPTYSKGVFYKNAKISEPLEKFDLYPQTEDTLQADACNLPHLDGQISSIMFDPPFIAGHTKNKPSGIMGERFHGFRYVKDLWEWYDKCLAEFYRVLDKKGILIFKCQDTVSSGKQHLSHVHIINEAEKLGFYTKDLFILLAKNRIQGHNHANQKHARKFHSYFIVFEKK
jgi:tRNA G10  N-methylase Trm11